MERENLCSDAKGEIASGSNREDQSSDAEHLRHEAQCARRGALRDRRGCKPARRRDGAGRRFQETSAIHEHFPPYCLIEIHAAPCRA